MSTMFKLNGKDLLRGLVMAVLTGAALPIAVAIQTPGFDISMISWADFWKLAENGAVIGFTAYVVKNFLSDSEGKVFGKIG